MIISTSRSRLGFLVDAVLTIIAWIAFIYLFGAGIVAILRGAAQGPQAPLWSTFLPTMGTLSAYLLVAAINAAILVAWAIYNHLRFAGLDRRTSPAAIGAAQLARSFALDAKGVEDINASKVVVIHHDEEGRIMKVM